LDNDGVEDIVVGAHLEDQGGTDSGAVYVLFMNTNGSVKSSQKIGEGSGGGPTLSDGDHFGESVAGIGDLNNDGVEDIAVGADSDDTGGGARGAVYILFMKTDGTVDSTKKLSSGSNGIPTLTDGDQFGKDIVNVGDLNNDGIDDLAVGAMRDDTGGDARGTIHILFMKTDGTVDSSVKIAHETNGGPTLSNSDEFGVSVGIIGDLNNDGEVDLIVGAYQDDTGTGSDLGAVYVINLKTISTDGNGKVSSSLKVASGTNGGPSLTTLDGFGISATRIGDLNNDGTYNIAVGAFRDDTGTTNRGAIYILNMTTTGTVSKLTKIAEGTNGGPSSLTNDDNFGNSVANIGDLDNDGNEDLVVGAYTDDTGGANLGAIYILFMNADGTAKSTAKIADDTNGGPSLIDQAQLGIGVEGIGDLNNDGIEDIAAGVFIDDTGGSGRGAFYIFNMTTTGTASSFVKIADSTNGGPSLTDGDKFGKSVTNIGDLNNDGVNDLVVSALEDDTGGTDRGAVYVLFMGTDGRASSTVKIASGTNGGPTLVDGGKFGQSVENIGDLNNDGVNDLAVGAFLDSDGGTGNGAMYILFMKTDGTVDSSVKIGDGTNGGPSLAVNDIFGTSIANIGDLNNDGFNDLVVGAYLDDTNVVDSGAIHVLFMDETTIVTDVTSTETDGTFSSIGTTLDITATFSEAVSVSGTPQLTLETGTTDRIVDYTSGTGTTTLTFQYTTQYGDTSSDLDYIATTSLSAGTSITETASLNNNAVLTLPTPGELGSISFNKELVISVPETTIETVAASVSSSDKSESTQYISEVESATPDASFSLPEEEYNEIVSESLATPILETVEEPVIETFENVKAPEKVEAAPEDTSFKRLSKSDDKEDDAKKLGLEYKDGDVRALVILDNTSDAILNEIKKFANVESTNQNLVQINIPLDDLNRLYKIPDITKVQPTSKAIQNVLTSQGYDNIQAQIPHGLGIQADGIKIAVLDLAFDDTNDEIKNNIAETKSFRHDFDGLKIPLDGFGNEAIHGTAVSEIVIDVAPKAELYLYTFAAEVEFLDAMDYAMEQNVDLITMSAGWVNYPTDGTSAMTKKVEQAINQGIPFVVSAGNYAETHWEGNYIDIDENGWHEFAPSDEGISVVASEKRVEQQIPFVLYLMWDSPSGTVYDFDLSMTDEEGDVISYSANLQESSNAMNFEYVYFTPEEPGTYSLGILYGGDESPDAVLELFSPSDKLEYPISRGSVSVPTDAKGVISVGAINYYDSRLEPFSSQGPTNNCIQAPSIMGPDAVATLAYNKSPFFGTSAAAPHVAGIVALMIDKTPQLTPLEILSELMANSDTEFSSYEELNNVFGFGAVDSEFIAVLDEIVEPIVLDDGCMLAKSQTSERYGNSDQQSKFAVAGIVNQQTIVVDEVIPIPEWVKKNAGWWSDGSMSDDTFINAIEFLIEKQIIDIPINPNVSVDSDNDVEIIEEEIIPIPDWIKNNAAWWSDGTINDDVFISAIQYLLEQGIIDV